MNLAVIILNWNQAAATIRCVNSLLAWTRAAPEVWVVDNASSDGSRELIPRSCPTVSCLYNDVNLGFAGGNNVALRKIALSKSEAVLLLNNDAMIAEDQALRLLAILRDNPRLGIVGPLLEERKANRRIFLAGGRDIARRLYTRRIYPIAGNAGSTVADSLDPVDYVPGTAALVRVDLLRTVGLLDEAYFFSGEMADFCRRARSSGWTCAISSQSVATHEQEAGAIRATLYRYYTLRNRFLFVRKHEPACRWRLFVFWLGCGALMAAFAFVRGHPAQARAAWLGLRDGLAGRFGNRNELFL